MDTQLILICFLTFIIHLVGTLAYAVRIAGIRTRRIALSLSLFNIMVLISRTSNSIQSPFISKRIENNLNHITGHNLLLDFRWFLLSASIATLIGAFLIPSFSAYLQQSRIKFSSASLRSPADTPCLFRGGGWHK